jgi:hypothetical protein
MQTVALVSDLMDRSRLSAAVADIRFVTDASQCPGAHVVVIDLARFGADVEAVRAAAPEARIIGFGPHVDRALLEDARAAGVDKVFPRSQLFRDVNAALETPAG